MLEFDDTYTVTDLKQFEFCQRVIFYERCLPHLRPRTYKMDAGRDAHELERKRAARRTLSRFGIEAGERFFDMSVTSQELGLRGFVDEVILTANDQAIPIDYKLAQRVGEHHQLQIAAYSMMIEEVTGRIVKCGYVYLIPKKEFVQVPLTDDLRLQVKLTVHHLRQMILQEKMPPPVEQTSRCAACEFRRFCNDMGL